jgi:hypothetical protein
MTAPPRDPTAGFEQLLDYRRQLLRRLEQQPGEFAAAVAAIPAAEWRTPRDAQGRSLAQLAAHIREVETQIYLPYVRRMLREAHPTLEPIHVPPGAGGEAMTDILEGWSRARAELAQMLTGLGPQGWSRTGFYPPVGSRTVQWWAERALGHAREHAASITA